MIDAKRKSTPRMCSCSPESENTKHTRPASKLHKLLARSVSSPSNVRGLSNDIDGTNSSRKSKITRVNGGAAIHYCSPPIRKMWRNYHDSENSINDSSERIAASPAHNELSSFGHNSEQTCTTSSPSSETWWGEAPPSNLSIEAAPLIAKLLRDELDRTDTFDEGSIETTRTQCTLLGHWPIGACVCAWILIASWVVRTGQTTPSIWDRLRFSIFVFASLGGNERRDARVSGTLLALGSLAIVGFALGKWGEHIIDAYESITASTGRKYHTRSTPPQTKSPRSSMQSPRTGIEKSLEAEDKYGSMSPISSISPSHHPRDTSHVHHNGDYPLNHERSSLFPRLPWLLIQSLGFTLFSMICARSIRYYENPYHSPHEEAISTNEFHMASSNTTLHHNRDPVFLLYQTISARANVSSPVYVPSFLGTVLELAFLPLSIVASTHWILYIAQSYIQSKKGARRAYKHNIGILHQEPMVLFLDDGEP